MTSLHESLLQDVMDWVELATSLPRERVRPRDDASLRPPLPYITVAIIVMDIEVGTDEVRYFTRRNKLKVAVDAQRTATISLNAYGRRGADLLAQCQTSLSLPKVQRFLDERKITIRPNGGTQDISQLVDTEIEARFVRDFALEYRTRTFQRGSEPHVEEVEIAGELKSQTHTPLPITLEVK